MVKDNMHKGQKITQNSQPTKLVKWHRVTWSDQTEQLMGQAWLNTALKNGPTITQLVLGKFTFFILETPFHQLTQTSLMVFITHPDFKAGNVQEF